MRRRRQRRAAEQQTRRTQHYDAVSEAEHMSCPTGSDRKAMRS
ncbi:hypothetical protein [Streptomyces synnematoformans]